MAGPGRAESASVPIWLKLSDVDAARMEKVLARPEFAGWTKAEWCLEMIQTALRYYTRTRPAADRSVFGGYGEWLDEGTSAAGAT